MASNLCLPLSPLVSYFYNSSVESSVYIKVLRDTFYSCIGSSWHFTKAEYVQFVVIPTNDNCNVSLLMYSLFMWVIHVKFDGLFNWKISYLRIKCEGSSLQMVNLINVSVRNYFSLLWVCKYLTFGTTLISPLKTLLFTNPLIHLFNFLVYGACVCE